MADAPRVLRAKLLAPQTPRGFVPRVRVRERLSLPRPVTLVCAPAGFGKTAVVAEWLQSRGDRVAWLSLDEDDDDASRLLVHLVATLKRVLPELPDELDEAASSCSEGDVPTLLAELVNALHEATSRGDAGSHGDVGSHGDAGRPFFVVLDDYHRVPPESIDDAIGFLVEHMPREMHLVITSRREPRLPLPRWRMRGLLTELGDSDLRFVEDEVAAFLSQTMGLDLTPEQTRLLEQRTEGWVGGLQLAALSLSRREDRDAFLHRFAGDDRHVLDYLTAEVLATLPADVQSFLLRTSVLERLEASLCEAITGREGAAEILERLERDRIFVVALDDKRQVYRYRRVELTFEGDHLTVGGFAKHGLDSAKLEGDLDDFVARAYGPTDALRVSGSVVDGDVRGTLEWERLDGSRRSLSFRGTEIVSEKGSRHLGSSRAKSDHDQRRPGS